MNTIVIKAVECKWNVSEILENLIENQMFLVSII